MQIRAAELLFRDQVVTLDDGSHYGGRSRDGKIAD